MKSGLPRCQLPSPVLRFWYPVRRPTFLVARASILAKDDVTGLQSHTFPVQTKLQAKRNSYQSSKAVPCYDTAVDDNPPCAGDMPPSVV